RGLLGAHPPVARQRGQRHHNCCAKRLNNAFHAGSSLRIVDESTRWRKANIDNVTFLYKTVRKGAQRAKSLCYIADPVRVQMRRFGAAVAIAVSGVAMEAQESSQ